MAQEHVREIGFGKLAPKWLDPRPDLLSVGGDSINEDSKWSRLRRELNEHEKRAVVARVIESAVLVCMSTYVYSVGPNLYLQCTGGPIGMRFTASLANVVMKHWDKAWVSLLKRENIKFDIFLRYVDDGRLFLPALNSGWVWSGTSFAYSKEQAEADNTDGTTYAQRTTREMIKAMCSLTDFLRFTGEDCSMFCEKIWISCLNWLRYRY